MAEIINQLAGLKRNSSSTMLLTLVLLFFTTRVRAQDGGNPLSTMPPSQQLPHPFMDLITGASSYLYPDIRKNYNSDPSYQYQISCPKTDTLGSFASILASAAKIMLATAALVFLKLLGAKMMLMPLTALLLAKVGLKAFLLWPMISRMIKFFRKKRKHKKSRMIKDCSQRIACIIQRSVHDGWASNLGAALTFTLIEDVEDDSALTTTLLDIIAGEKVSKCMAIECSSGVDIS